MINNIRLSLIHHRKNTSYQELVTKQDILIAKETRPLTC